MENFSIGLRYNVRAGAKTDLAFGINLVFLCMGVMNSTSEWKQCHTLPKCDIRFMITRYGSTNFYVDFVQCASLGLLVCRVLQPNI